MIEKEKNMSLLKDKDLTELELTDKPTESSLHPDIKNVNKRTNGINSR